MCFDPGHCSVLGSARRAHSHTTGSGVHTEMPARSKCSCWSRHPQRVRELDIAGQCRGSDQRDDRDAGQSQRLGTGRIGMSDVQGAIDRYPAGDGCAMAEYGSGPDRSDHCVQMVASDLFGRERRSDGVQSGSEPLCFPSLGEAAQSAVLGLGGSDELAVGRRRCEIHRGKSAPTPQSARNVGEKRSHCEKSRRKSPEQTRPGICRSRSRRAQHIDSCHRGHLIATAEGSPIVERSR